MHSFYGLEPRAPFNQKALLRSQKYKNKNILNKKFKETNFFLPSFSFNRWFATILV